MIGPDSFRGIYIMTAGGILIPVVVCLWWLLSKKEKFTTVLAGAATWFVFAMILERIPLSLLLNPQTSLGRTLTENAALYTLIAASFAGIFEETGRYVVFRTALRNRTNRETSISHGIGHGGFEAMFLMGVTGIQYLSSAVMINTGSFTEMVEQAAAAGADVAGLEALPAQIAAITTATGLLSVGERIFAMILHVGLSIMVFYAARDSKPRLYGLAIVLHALFDVPAALYQKGLLGMYAVEAMLAVYAVAFFVMVYMNLYKKDEPVSA